MIKYASSGGDLGGWKFHRTCYGCRLQSDWSGGTS